MVGSANNIYSTTCPILELIKTIILIWKMGQNDQGCLLVKAQPNMLSKWVDILNAHRIGSVAMHRAVWKTYYY